MNEFEYFKGYDINFIDAAPVEFPVLAARHLNDLAVLPDTEDSKIHYMNYSLEMSASRKFPFYTASNIDGTLFKKANRKKNWKKDSRLKDFQWGTELYEAKNSDFDKGHMTKREDVQWGETPAIAQMAANSTFYYTNAVPQHADLNQDIWKSLEDYILHTETNEKLLKVCVFTGPVLSPRDPVFVSEVKGQEIKLPILFWKVIIFTKSDGQLYKVGFMMSQNKLLVENEIIVEEEIELATEEDKLFMEFEDAETYQVNISLIERLSGVKTNPAIEPYKDSRSQKLVLEEIDVDPELESFSPLDIIGFRINNLKL